MGINEVHVEQLLEIIANAIELGKELDPAINAVFFQSPEICLDILSYMEQLDEGLIDDEDNGLLPACVYALEICLSQLQSDIENGARSASRILKQCMAQLSQAINLNHHSLPFWLPALNAFYDVGVELSKELKTAYFDLAQQDPLDEADTEYDHLEAIKALIAQSQELSDYEIAENFFSQTYAMPADFFVDLIFDLMALPEGQCIGLLFLMHPNPDVRHVVFETLSEVIGEIKLSSTSLSRLQIIRNWYPGSQQATLDSWIKQQRKLGTVFAKQNPALIIQLKATEVDGAGSQGLFFHIRDNSITAQGNHRLCGSLLKLDHGVKDVWITQPLTATDAKSHFRNSLQENVTLRAIDLDYCHTLLNHFLAISLHHGHMPGISFLHLQELLPIKFKPELIDTEQLLEDLCLAITPFTQEAMTASFKRSKSWLTHKAFTESWFSIDAEIDKTVNQHSSIVDGVKICDVNAACLDVMQQVFEQRRDKWSFHFIWMALWMKSSARRNEKAWQDCVFIAYAIAQNKPLKEIPLIWELCKSSIQHSIETMQERKTHLS